MTKIIDLEIKEKNYINKKSKISILNNFSLKVEAGEKIAIVGKSGAGKSSLLNILGLIDRSYIGTYNLFDIPTNKASSKYLATCRNEKVGFVLQESALINSMSIEDNIKLPLFYAKSSCIKSRMFIFDDLVKNIDIVSILDKKPLDCSGGEKARAVFARGVIMNPPLILCDEPTSSLDTENKERIINLLFKMNKEFNTTIITVTHDYEVANRHDRVIYLERSE